MTTALRVLFYVLAVEHYCVSPNQKHIFKMNSSITELRTVWFDEHDEI